MGEYSCSLSAHDLNVPGQCARECGLRPWCEKVKKRAEREQIGYKMVCETISVPRESSWRIIREGTCDDLSQNGGRSYSAVMVHGLCRAGTPVAFKQATAILWEREGSTGDRYLPHEGGGRRVALRSASKWKCRNGCCARCHARRGCGGLGRYGRRSARRDDWSSRRRQHWPDHWSARRNIQAAGPGPAVCRRCRKMFEGERLRSQWLGMSRRRVEMPPAGLVQGR